MSKAVVNSSPMKQEMNPYKKDNRGQHSNSSNDKRNSDSFKSNRDRDRSSRQDRSREEYDRRGGAHDDDEKTTEKTTESATSGEKKFTGRCRLFVGNLTPDISEADFKKLFEQYGEISEVYVNTSRGFGFIRLDYRQNAEAAKAGLDGTQRKGRILRVRFATHGAALKVKNLHPYVSNELLEQSFSQFGDLERCIVIVDDRGKSTGEGIVEFVRKPGANSALRRINEGVFLMGVDPKPVAVEPLEQKDEEDGMPEKFLTKTEQYKKEREKEPRFAPPGTFEYEFGMRWKQLEELEKQRIDQVKKDTEEARLKLEDEMQNALYEYQAEQIRQDLIRQQEELRRLEELRNSDRLRRQQEMEMRRQQQDAQQEERRRADMMMSMRQQDIARGRSGHIDGPGMRSREELMMAERFGDRMPERMSERMLDRMNDRMGGQGPPGGFNMWQEEKQRSEAMRNEQMRNEQMRNEQTRNEAMRGDANIRNEGNMRNEAGRGRDMRGPGPGASPNQPQGGAQSGMNNMERGGPPSSASAPSNAGPAGQNVKSSPKPLMQGGPGGPGGNFGMGGPQNNNAGGGPNNMGNSGGDGGNMGETNGNQETPAVDDSCLALSLEEETDKKTEVDAPSPSSTSKHLINCEDDTTDLSPPLPIGRETKEYWSAFPSRPPLTSSLDECPNGADELVEESAIQSSCGASEEAKKSMLPGGSPHRSIPEDSYADLCNDSEMLDEKILNEESEEQENDVISKYTTEPEKYSYEKCLIDERECQIEQEQNSERSPLARNIPFSDLCDSMNVVTSGNSLSHRESSSIQSYITSNSSYSTSSPPAQTHLSSNAYQTITSPLRSDSSHGVNLSSLNQGCESYQSVSNKSDCPPSLETERIAHCIPSTSENTPVSYQTASPIQTSSYDRKTVNPSVLSDQKTDRDFEPPMSQLSSEFDSHQGNVDSHYSPCDPQGVSSYKQRLFGESEEEMDEESSSQRKAISSDYQSYDGNVTVAPYVPLTQIQDNSQLQEVCFEDLSLNNEQVAMSENPSNYISSDADGMLNSEANDNTYTSSEANDNSYTSAAVIDSVDVPVVVPTDVCEIVGNDNEVPVPVQSPPFVHKETVDNNEGALRTGDQNFKTTTSSSSQHACHSSSRASRVNAMPYTGATIVQGVKQPAMMSSSTMHIAQHQGATIMQHQSMTTGYPGGLAQATVVQKQALPNGMQTAMMQQRTITNGGQTMLVQQRTMTNVVGGGLAQQTVVQQRMVPSSVAQSAAMHAEALRQRALATQQATMMQQQAMRMAQVRVMGNPLLQAQAIRKPTVIQQAGPSGLLGPRLVQASAARGSVMQRLVRQRYMGSPVLPARGVQMISGRPVRVKLAYTRDALGFGSNT